MQITPTDWIHLAAYLIPAHYVSPWLSADAFKWLRCSHCCCACFIMAFCQWYSDQKLDSQHFWKFACCFPTKIRCLLVEVDLQTKARTMNNYMVYLIYLRWFFAGFITICKICWSLLLVALQLCANQHGYFAPNSSWLPAWFGCPKGPSLFPSKNSRWNKFKQACNGFKWCFPGF